MRLAIADPPYLGRAERHYGAGAGQARGNFGSGSRRARTGRKNSRYTTTEHPDAWLWDIPATHQMLVRDLCEHYDGWAISMWPTSLYVYLAVAPDDARVGVAEKMRPVPSGSRITTAWEPVLFYVPPARRGRGSGLAVRDVLRMSTTPEADHVGAKPAEWTRWVLAVLGYDPATDTVDDLFPGSGAVTDAIAAASGALDFDTEAS